jgi:hypothetical protein
LPLSRRSLLAIPLAALPGCGAAHPGALAEPFRLPPLPEGSPLRALGGFEIAPSRLGFGALSGLHLASDLTLTAISDLAYFAEFTLTFDAELRPVGLALRRAGRLGDGAGRPLARGYTGDAEALARLPDGSWLVGFERWHRIRRYRDLGGPGLYVAAPPGLQRAPSNAGLESLAVLTDGRWLALAEDLALPDRPGVTAVWLGRPGAWVALGWRAEEGMWPVDATPLPDGGALVRERGFSLFRGFSGRLLRVSARALAEAMPGTLLAGEEILRLAPPLPVDNYEGVAATLHQGRQLVALVSDDNGNGLQRTLLLLFELLP